MASRSRSNITIADRVDAVTEAMRVVGWLRQDSRWPSPATDNAQLHCFRMVNRLREPVIDRAAMRATLDQLLAVRLQPAHLTAYVRINICHLENALRLQHDDRSVAALLAWGDGSNYEGWRAYVDGVEREDAPCVTIEVPTVPEAWGAPA